MNGHIENSHDCHKIQYFSIFQILKYLFKIGSLKQMCARTCLNHFGSFSNFKSGGNVVIIKPKKK